MPIKNYKPTSPSRRHLSVTDYSVLTNARRTKRLTERIKRSAGRNNQGRITTRHQGGGNKNLYRTIDFKQEKIGVPGRVESIEYDPYRTAFIALVVYRDGDRRYILAPHGLKVGSPVINSPEAPLQVGSRTALKRIPVGSFVHNIEIFPQGGAKIGRSAGVSIQVLANEDGYTHLKMASGEVRKVFWDCAATIGQVSNPENNLVVFGKAGRSRWLNIRPTVRGKVMNPRDHPYGGGEGSTQRGTRRPKTKWGKITGGRKTRNPNKRSNLWIVSRRSKKVRK